MAPTFTGLAWAVPAAMWTGLVVGEMDSNAPGLGLSLLVPAAVCTVASLMLETRLTWPGRLLATALGIAPVLTMVLVGFPSGTLVDAILSAIIPLAWATLVVSLVAGHIPPLRALAERGRLRFVPLGIWMLLTSAWVIAQTSPTSQLAMEGPFLEVQMLTIAGLAALEVLLVSAVADQISPLRRRTTGAGRIR
jgi:hypothetical protein